MRDGKREGVREGGREKDGEQKRRAMKVWVEKE